MQDANEELNYLIRRVYQIIKVQQTREQVNERFQEYQNKMKIIFDRRVKERFYSFTP
jgi:hypothetical protein